MGPHQGRGKGRARRTREGRPPDPTGALAGVPVGLPALTRALKLQDKASKVGFDWNDPLAVLAKIREEGDEIEAELAAGQRARRAAEVGDLLFAMVNLARHLDGDPEATLRTANQKFERRFASIEHALASAGQEPTDATLAEMDALWDAAKAAGRLELPATTSSREADFAAPVRLRIAELGRAACSALAGSTRTVIARCAVVAPSHFSSTSALR